MNDILHLSALEQAKLVRERKVSSEELVRFYLDRIGRLDSRTSAFAQVLADSAIRSARKKDREVRRSGPDRLPPFHGVPSGVKDLNFMRGTFTRLGSRAWRYVLSPMDDLVTASMRQGGFVILGKLTTSEFGAMPVTEPDIHPPTRNPWDPGVSSGGSSGGSGSAVAAGFMAVAQGSDGAGSVRIPAAFCHLYGLKPSGGLLPDPYGDRPNLGLATAGPLTQSVADAAAMLDVMAAPRRRVSLENPDTYFSRSQKPVSRLRIRYTLRSAIGRTEPEIAGAVMRVLRTLESLGHMVEEGAPIEGNLEEFLPIWQQQVAGIPALLGETTLQPITKWLRETGKRFTLADVAGRHRMLKERVLGWFGDADIWITPTVAVSPPAVGVWNRLPPDRGFAEAAQLGAFTALFNISGQPAANIPAGLTTAGHPAGVQVVGPPGGDVMVLQLSRQIEEALPWADRRSPMMKQ